MNIILLLLGTLNSLRRLPSRALLFTATILLSSLCARNTAFAGSATWKTSARTGNWNAAKNWTAGGPPDGATDTATFNASKETALFLSANTEVNGVVFNADASAFTITASPTFALTLSGVGITNNSGITQNFVTTVNRAGDVGIIEFANNATAGSGTAFTNNGAVQHGAGQNGEFFRNSSTAGNATFINNGAMHLGSPGSIIQFSDSSSAGNGTFTNNGPGVINGNGGVIVFADSSTADHGSFTNNGGVLGGHAFRVGTTLFETSSTAAHGTFINNGGTSSGEDGGTIFFLEGSSADHGTFTVNGGAVSDAGGGIIAFFSFGNPTAGNGIFTLNGGAVSRARGARVDFVETSTADGATLILNGGAVRGAGGSRLRFRGTASAGHAKLIAKGDVGKGQGSKIEFLGATGGTAQVEVFDKATMEMAGPSGGPSGVPLTIGSLEGTGAIFLGARNLTVGSNGLTTTFSGVIHDGGPFGGTGGSLGKIGSGKFVLRHANDYTGGTTINGGKLVVNNRIGSGTGSGVVQVNAGRLGGRGTIAGAVSIGTGSGLGATLSPGNSAVTRATLTILSTLRFNSDATYNFWLDTSNATADEVVALGVTINSGAQFSFSDFRGGTLTRGTVFTVINNTAATPIAGTFSNLPDGSTFTSNGNTYKVNYEGGDGNDLTLTVQ